MKILLTGATGYIGKRLLPVLVKDGHEVVCSVRDRNRFNPPEYLKEKIEVIEVDFLKKDTLASIPKTIDVAYYLMHSMSASEDYQELESLSATNFKEAINETNTKQVIYLSGIVNEQSLSKHLLSRKSVEEVLGKGTYNLTTLRAGIIIGSGSASFEIIRDLVEKLPVMITPKWLNTKCQPIGIQDVISHLTKVMLFEGAYNQSFDIGGPDILSYKEMLLGFAKVRGLKRTIIIVPVMTPKLSSYWLYFVTSISFKLASALVSSMKVEVICRDTLLTDKLGIKTLSYQEALERTFRTIEQNHITSSWKDSFISGELTTNLSEFLTVPLFGCFTDRRTSKIADRQATLTKIWKIGGETGWYYANTLWKIRGFIDKLFGGVGLRRGRTDPNQLSMGDAIDFWRVLYANQEEGRLLLFAEMKLPGEAWLEFNLSTNELIQTATFRPKGLLGRMYWYAVLPFHGLIFKNMLRKLS